MVLIAALKSEASISFRVTLLTGKSSKLACFCQYVLPCKINPREFTSVSEIREPPRNRGRPREFARAANSRHQLRIRGGTRNRAIRCDIAMAGYCSGSANSQRPRIRSGSANSHKTKFTNEMLHECVSASGPRPFPDHTGRKYLSSPSAGHSFPTVPCSFQPLAQRAHGSPGACLASIGDLRSE